MNKEIEELLNELKRRNERYNYCKNNDISFSDEDYQSYLLLSYIEQLEEEIHKKEAMYDSLAVDYRLSQEQNEQLENNRDKAIEFIENHFLYHYGSDKEPIVFEDNYIQEIVDILKGDSE